MHNLVNCTGRNSSNWFAGACCTFTYCLLHNGESGEHTLTVKQQIAMALI